MTKFGSLVILSSFLHTHLLLVLFLTLFFCVTPYNHKLQRSFHSYKTKLRAKSYGTSFPKNSIHLSIFIWNCPMWHHPKCCHYPMCYPMKTSWLCSLDTHFSLTWSLILEIFSAMNSMQHFLHIHQLDFHLENIFLPSNSEKILWNNKFLQGKIFFLENSRWPLLLIKPWTLNFDYKNFSSLYFGILQAYPPNFYWILNHWQQSKHSTNFFFFFNCYNLEICVATLIEITSTNYRDNKT